MLVKKLAVPLINEKILQQAEYCYIATSAISDEGFDLIASRLSVKCKVELLTGLDGTTSPKALWRIWKHFTDRISLKIHTRSFFHANVYIFDLPFRKSVAFIGSGSFTLSGLKDDEEIFYKVNDPKEIEALKSWFIGYYEYAEPIHEAIIQEYASIYPSLRQREIASRQEKEDAIALSTRGFSWDAVKFKHQFFKKEDYHVFAFSNVALHTAEIRAERERVRDKLLELHRILYRDITLLKLHESANVERIVVGTSPEDHHDQRVRSLSLLYGRRDAELKRMEANTNLQDVLSMQVVIRHRDVLIAIAGGIGKGKLDREFIQTSMADAAYRNTFFTHLAKLDAGYWIEVAGERKPVESFKNDEELLRLVQQDDWRYYAFAIGKIYLPGDGALGVDQLATTVAKEFEKLMPVYRHLEKPL